MEIRVYEDSDRPQIVELWRICFPNDPPHNRPEDDIARKLKVQRELFFVAEIDGKIVGSAMSGFDGHRGWVYLVATHPDYQRNGIGTALMKRVEEGLKAIGCHKLNLQVRAENRQVVEFYRALGYEIEERVSMAKHLR
jgi:ribosomal protein S18 acetylase RimI-like enzyme